MSRRVGTFLAFQCQLDGRRTKRMAKKMRIGNAAVNAISRERGRDRKDQWKQGKER
jgi:hypothetical protein